VAIITITTMAIIITTTITGIVVDESNAPLCCECGAKDGAAAGLPWRKARRF
jgi:hypothetical protein